MKLQNVIYDYLLHSSLSNRTRVRNKVCIFPKPVHDYVDAFTSLHLRDFDVESHGDFCLDLFSDRKAL